MSGNFSLEFANKLNYNSWVFPANGVLYPIVPAKTNSLSRKDIEIENV